MNQCLMIKTKDNRKFFTHEKYFPQLIEFSKTFDAEISIVKIKDDNVLDLNDLVPAICNANYKNTTDYELVKTKIAQLSNIVPDRPVNTNRSTEIRNYIEQQFYSGGIVSFKHIFDKFEKYNLDKSTLSNHIAKVKKELIKQGRVVERVKKGEYMMK